MGLNSTEQSGGTSNLSTVQRVGEFVEGVTLNALG
jgi:hypothetical protein